MQDADELPSDDKLRSRVISLNTEKSITGQTAEHQEAVVYVLDGVAQVTVGKLSGRLGANDFVNVPIGTSYSIQAADTDASVLFFEMPGE